VTNSFNRDFLALKATHWHNRPMRITYRQSRDVHGIGEAAYLDKHRDAPAGSSDPRVGAWHASQQAETDDGLPAQTAVRRPRAGALSASSSHGRRRRALVDLVRFSLRAVLHITSLSA